MVLLIDTDRCDGCGACAEVCPAGALSVEDGVAILSQALCRQCEACVEACPQGAIVVVYEPATEETRLPQPAAKRALQTPAGGESRVATLAARTLPWLGAAALFVGREILPRVATALLDSWEGGTREATRSADRVAQESASTPEGGTPLGLSGGRQRQRQRRGRLGGGKR